MELITKSKRPGMDCSIDVYYEETVGFSKHLRDNTSYKLVLMGAGSCIVEDKDNYIVITAPAAIAINEKSDFKIISESNIKSRTIYFRPNIIRNEFTIEALNSGKYDKFMKALEEEEEEESDDMSGASVEERLNHLITGNLKFDDDFSNEMIYQDAIYLMGFLQKDWNIRCFMLTIQEYNMLRRHFISVRYEINEQPDNYWILRTRFFIQSILFIGTADFYRNYRLDDIYKNPLVASVTRYFWDHIDEEITLESVLKEFSINKNVLNDAFNKEVSMSCMTYLEQMRINFAKVELQYGNHTVGEISVGVGYSDTNYFSKVFKKHTGLTPSDFQKQMKALC